MRVEQPHFYVKFPTESTNGSRVWIEMCEQGLEGLSGLKLCETWVMSSKPEVTEAAMVDGLSLLGIYPPQLTGC